MAPQRPLKGEPPERHTIYATDGSRWSFTAHGPRREIKAIDTLGNGRLLILERSGKRGERSTVLRELDPSACPADGACQAPELGGAADLGSDKYEGLTNSPAVESTPARSCASMQAAKSKAWFPRFQPARSRALRRR